MASATREPTRHTASTSQTSGSPPREDQATFSATAPEGGAEQGHTGEVRHSRQDRTRQPPADGHQDGHPRFLELIDEQRGDDDTRHEAVEAEQNAEEPIPQEAREQPSPK